MRWVFLLVFLAIGAAAQANDEPEFDPSILEACLADAEIADKLDCVGKVSARCMESEIGDTTIGMSFCIGKEFELWDARLNTAYQSAMAVSEDSDSRNQGLGAEKQAPLLKEMQRSWIAFRDATCAFERSQFGSGTGGGPAEISCLLRMTARQAEYLDGFTLPD